MSEITQLTNIDTIRVNNNIPLITRTSFHKQKIKGDLYDDVVEEIKTVKEFSECVDVIKKDYIALKSEFTESDITVLSELLHENNSTNISINTSLLYSDIKNKKIIKCLIQITTHITTVSGDIETTIIYPYRYKIYGFTELHAKDLHRNLEK